MHGSIGFFLSRGKESAIEILVYMPAFLFLNDFGKVLGSYFIKNLKNNTPDILFSKDFL